MQPTQVSAETVQKNWLPWLILITLALVWGSSFILIKKGLVGFPADQVASIRILSASLVLLPFAVSSFRQVPRYRLKYILFAGVFGNLLPAFLFALAQTRISSGLTGVLNAITPVATLIIGVVFFSQRFSIMKITGVVIGLGGSLWLIVYSTGISGGEDSLYGLLVLAACICYGASINVIKYKLEGVRPLHISALALSMIGPWAGFYLLLTDFSQRAVLPSNLSGLAAIIVLGVVGTALALIIFNRLIQLTGPLFTSSVTYLIPIVALCWGLWLGEDIGWRELAGMAVIMVGVAAIRKG